MDGDESLALQGRDLRELARWIVHLRTLLAAGALAHVAPIDLGHGTDILPAETTVRTMLADLDHLNQLPDGASDRQARLLLLLGDFGRLRLLIG